MLDALIDETPGELSVAVTEVGLAIRVKSWTLKVTVFVWWRTPNIASIVTTYEPPVDPVQSMLSDPKVGGITT